MVNSPKKKKRINKSSSRTKSKAKRQPRRPVMSMTTTIVLFTIVPLLLTGFFNYFAHKNWILYFPVVGLALAIIYFGHLGIKSLGSPPKERPDAPYVVPRFCRLLEPLAAGKPPRFDFQFENISTTEEAKFDLWDVTFHYTTDMSVKTLQYKPSKHTPGKIGPTQKLGTRPYTPLNLTEEQVGALNETPAKARLFIYARVSYTDETGSSHDLSFCREYNAHSYPDLIVCDESIIVE